MGAILNEKQIRALSKAIKGIKGDEFIVEDRRDGTVTLENAQTLQTWSIDLDGKVTEVRPL